MISAPESLKQGDTIGIIAPASPVTPDEIRPAIDIIRQEGYRILEGIHLYDKKSYLAGKDEDRVSDLHEMFRNREVRAVLCARGGYGTPRLLDMIDYEIIRENPKIFTGYSDITALLLAIHFRTGLTVWHGPMLKGIEGRENNLIKLLKHLSSGDNINYSLDGKAVLKKGKSRGVVIGGNLSLISSMIGTSFLPSLKGAILFLEDRGEPLYKVDRMLTHLKLTGAFDNISGLIAGEFQDCGDMEEIRQLLLKNFSGNYPVYTGFPAGHGKENYPIPFGLNAELDTESLLFKVDSFTGKD